MMNNKCKPKDKIAMNVCGPAGGVLPTLTTYMAKLITPQLQHGKNILCQRMMELEKTKYIIKWDFDLDGKTITVPEHCILEFDGGSLKNGTIIGQDTYVNNVGGVELVFGAGITQEGTWRYSSQSSDPRGGISREAADELYQPKGSYQPAGNYLTPSNVDSELSDTSEHPVQNKVVKAAIDLNANAISSLNGVEKGHIESDGEQFGDYFWTQNPFRLQAGDSVTVKPRHMLESQTAWAIEGTGYIPVATNTFTYTAVEATNILVGFRSSDEYDFTIVRKKINVNTLYSTTEFAQFIYDIEPGQYFGAAQALAVTNDYFILILSQDVKYTDDTTIIGLNVCVLYDRNFNYLGYAPIDKYSHPNGATVVGDKLLICISSRSLDSTVSCHRVDIENLVGNCKANKGKVFSIVPPNNTCTIGSTLTSTVLEIAVAEELRIDGRFVSMDYDPVTREYAVIGPNYVFRHYDENFNLLHEYGNFLQVLSDDLGRGLTMQDIGYKDGYVYMFLWDYHYPTTPNEEYDNYSSAGVLFIVDPNTGKRISATAITYEYFLSEPEGVCKDPITGDFYGCCNVHAASQREGLTVVRYSDKHTSGIVNKWKIDNNKHVNQSRAVTIYVDNSFEGLSNGSQKHPFKTLGEALMLIPYLNRPQICLHSTNNPYYSYYLFFSDCTLRLLSDDTSVENHAVLDAYIRFRHCHVTIDNINFKCVKSHPAGSSTAYSQLYVQQNSHLFLTNCVFTKSTADRTHLISCYDGYNKILLQNFTANNEYNNDRTAVIIFSSVDNSLIVRDNIIINNLRLVNNGDGNTSTIPYLNYVGIQDYKRITGENFMITSISAQKNPKSIFLGTYYTLEQINEIKAAANLFDDYRAYFYFMPETDIVSDNEIYTRGNYFIAKGTIEKEDKDSIEVGDGINLFNDPGYNKFMRYEELPSSKLSFTHFREAFGRLAGFLPEVVDVDIDGRADIIKGIRLTNSSSNLYYCNTIQDIKKDSLEEGSYVCSMYVKGTGRLRVGFYISKEYIIDEEPVTVSRYLYQYKDINTTKFTRVKLVCPVDYEILHLFDDYDDGPDHLSFSISAANIDDTDITVTAPKLEKGDIATAANMIGGGKGILVIGDGILKGTRNDNKAFLPYVTSAYKNVSLDGATISNVNENVKSIVQQLVEVTDFDPDIIIAGTGINDWKLSAISGDMPTSIIKSSEEEDNLDLSTVFGGLQKLFYEMIVKFPRAKRFFISTHRTDWENYKYYTEKNTAEIPYNYADLTENIKNICKLYGVIYIDILNEGIMDSAFNSYIAYDSENDERLYFDVNPAPTEENKELWNKTYYCDGDGVHPLDKGYREIYAPIVKKYIN